jgi:hypothetical protein
MTLDFAKREATRRTDKLGTSHYVYQMDGGYIVTARSLLVNCVFVAQAHIPFNGERASQHAVQVMDTSTNLTAQRRRKKMTKVYQVRWFQTVEVSAPVDAQSEKEAVRLVRKGKYGERGVWQGNYQVIKSSIRAELDKNLMARFYPE